VGHALHTRLGMPNRLIAHATRKEQLTEVGLDSASIARSASDALTAAAQPTIAIHNVA
jgi:deoxyxylulose-5-phosphate synthase